MDVVSGVSNKIAKGVGNPSKCICDTNCVYLVNFLFLKHHIG